MVLLYPKSVFVHHSQKTLTRCGTLFRRPGKPFECFLMIGRNSHSLEINHAEIVLRLRFSQPRFPQPVFQICAIHLSYSTLAIFVINLRHRLGRVLMVPRQGMRFLGHGFFYGKGSLSMRFIHEKYLFNKVISQIPNPGFGIFNFLFDIIGDFLKQIAPFPLGGIDILFQLKHFRERQVFQLV